MKKNVKILLINQKGNDAFQIVLKNNNVLRWKEEETFNCTFIHWAWLFYGTNPISFNNY